MSIEKIAHSTIQSDESFLCPLMKTTICFQILS